MNIKIFRSVIFIVAFFLFASFAWAEDWVLYESSQTGNKYYEKSSMKEAGKNIIRVWVLKVYNKEGKEKDFAMLKKRKLKAPTSADALIWNSVIAEIDCANKKIKPVSWTIYDNKKNVVYNAPKSIGKWTKIGAKLSTEKLRKMVCSSSKSSGTKKK
jgi:hypothetical protein